MTASTAHSPQSSIFQCSLQSVTCCYGTRQPAASPMSSDTTLCICDPICSCRFLQIMTCRASGDSNDAFTQAGRTRDQQEVFSYVQALLRLRREHAALRAGQLWHLASDESSYVFVRESEEERLVVAFNNAAQQRELLVPLNDTPAQRAAAIRLLFGEAKAELTRSEIRLTMPAQSLSIFALN